MIGDRGEGPGEEDSGLRTAEPPRLTKPAGSRPLAITAADAYTVAAATLTATYDLTTTSSLRCSTVQQLRENECTITAAISEWSIILYSSGCFTGSYISNKSVESSVRALNIPISFTCGRVQSAVL